ncbi:hypothetical protein M404DRAFT_762302 [Pisolithus tinctorius Marx 270]|uniref:Uncharacterized protein n=1 Tax=Pisolithus tinctorius Marx 270 TaxID=870435 RepID=A0A0C3NYM2_PISTI|nr:hypothetical protein M404DRAFT_762302 [Pisolithus tinctorius Marx 270]
MPERPKTSPWSRETHPIPDHRAKSKMNSVIHSTHSVHTTWTVKHSWVQSLLVATFRFKD